MVHGKNAKNDTYLMEYSLSSEPVTGLLLETLQDSSMTKGGLARSNSGNFVLTEIELAVVDGDKVTPLKIANADATFEQGSLVVEAAFDGKPKTGWAV